MSAAEVVVLVLPVVSAGFYGAALASFACVVAERVPSGISIGGRSHCVCGRQLRAAENVPVLSWLVLRGRARCCGAAIPARYVLAEATAAGAAAVGLLAGGVLGAVVLGSGALGVILAWCWGR